VREWLKSLDAEDRRIIGEDSKDVEFSCRLGCRWYALLAGNCGKFEAACLMAGSPVIFSVESDCMVLLQGFMKKVQKTPKQEIDLALRRKKGTGP
jgi:hypothetical protein